MMTNSNVDEKMTTIQFLTLDGSRKRISLAASKTISQLWEEIETLYKGVCRNLYYLVQLYPRIVYDDKTLSSTLFSLGLVPTGNLGFEKRKQPKNSETINQEETQAKKEIGEREKQRALYEEQRREQLRIQKEEKVRRENLLKEMKANQELLALRSAPVIPKSDKPDVQRLQNRIDGETQIQLVKLDGTKMTLSLSEKITISQLWDEIESRYGEVERSKFRLVQPHPRKIYDGESMSSNLISLGLSPTATLKIEDTGFIFSIDKDFPPLNSAELTKSDKRRMAHIPEKPKKTFDDVKSFIQIWLPNGSKMELTMSHLNTISTIWIEIEKIDKSWKKSHLLAARNRDVVYGEDTFETTLTSLGLSPFANLTLVLRKLSYVERVDCAIKLE